MLRALIALLILLLALPARAFEVPGLRISHPCRGRAEPGASWTRYVDGFLEATYDLDLQSDGSRLSKLLQLRYDDGTVLHVDLDDIKDARWPEEVIDQAIRDAAVCDSGRLFPREMNRGTTPRLHAAKAEVLRIMDDYNSEFILGHAFPAVFLIVTSTMMPGMAASSVKRRALPGRIVRQRGYTAAQGRKYDKAHQFDYPYRQLHIDKKDGQRYILDAYDDQKGEIVSRKLTELGDIQEQSALAEVRELSRKYCPGDLIARVPSSGPLAGRPLEGKQILEISIQTRPVPSRVIVEANRLKIIIRDVAGKVYNEPAH